MATFAELLTLWDSEPLFNKIRVAVIVVAEDIRAESDATPKHAERLAWAKNAIANPDGVAVTMRNAVLAQNAAADLSAITGATDVQVKSAVAAAVDFFV